MKNQKNIVITGTHHTPAIELVNLLHRDTQTSWNIFYIGHLYPTETHILHTIIPKLGVSFYNLDCGKFDRKNLDKTLLGIPKTIAAIFRSFSLLTKIKPDVVVSFGGYVSVPVVIASYFKKIPSLTHEQTLVNSLATKINSHFVNKIALSFNNSDQIKELPEKKVVVTGNLLRQAIFHTHSSKFKKTDKLPLIYITGGNQGSEFINHLTLELIPKLNRQFTIIHQTGHNFPAHHFPNYQPTPYVEIEDIGWVLNHAQIIISRAGANICQELDVLQKKSILIPLPFTQRNEQTLNAQWLRLRHPDSVIIISQSEAKTGNLLDSISRLSKLPPAKTAINPTVNLQLLKLIHELC